MPDVINYEHCNCMVNHFLYPVFDRIINNKSSRNRVTIIVMFLLHASLGVVSFNKIPMLAQLSLKLMLVGSGIISHIRWNWWLVSTSAKHQLK